MVKFLNQVIIMIIDKKFKSLKIEKNCVEKSCIIK